MKKLTNIDREEFKQKLDEGFTQEQLAKYFNCGISTIKRRKREFNLVGYKTNKKPLKDKDLQFLETLANNGVSATEAASQLGRCIDTLRKYTPEHIYTKLCTNSHIIRSNKIRKTTFENLLNPNEETAYIIGYLCADGCVTKSGEISAISIDKELIEHCCEFFGASLHVFTRPESDKPYYRFTATNFQMVEKIKEITGLIPNKTYKNYEIPTWIKHNDNFMWNFIAGLFDGDGYVNQLINSHRVQLGIELHKNHYEFLKELNSWLNWNFYSTESTVKLHTKRSEITRKFADEYLKIPYVLNRKKEILLRYSLSK